MKTVILYDRAAIEGGHPDQSDALVQARVIGPVLSDLGYEPADMTFSMDVQGFLKSIEDAAPQLVFNLVESVEGHGRLIHLAPSILDVLGIRYTGSSSDALYMTSNKILTKKILKGNNLPTPEWFGLADLGEKSIRTGGPLIIKSVWEHASIGLEESSVVSVKKTEDLLREMERRRLTLGGECFAEQFIDGREFNLSILASQEGPELLPPAEMRFIDYPSGKRKVLGYRAKWDEGSFEFLHTRRGFDFTASEGPLLQDLADLAKRCWQVFGLRGYARVDFRVDKMNRPWVLEINANPCLSPDSGFAAAAEQAGLNFKQVIQRIIQDVPLPQGGVGSRAGRSL